MWTFSLKKNQTEHLVQLENYTIPVQMISLSSEIPCNSNEWGNSCSSWKCNVYTQYILYHKKHWRNIAFASVFHATNLGFF